MWMCPEHGRDIRGHRQSVAVNQLPGANAVALGTPVPFQAIATLSDSSTYDVTSLATWTSLNAGVADNSATGSRSLFESLSVGTADYSGGF